MAKTYLDKDGLTHLLEKLKETVDVAGGGASFEGTSSQIVLGDGTTQDITEFLTNNIETIRTALGIVTTEKIGLVPVLPSN